MTSYTRLGVALALSLVLMFLLTMSMVRTLDHFYLNLSNFYMALIMVAPMGIIMLLVMWPMFADRRLNAALLAGFLVLFAGRSGWVARKRSLATSSSCAR